MDRVTIERNLAQVERDLRAASEDIAHQHEALKDLTRHGDDTTEAVRSIGILEHTTQYSARCAISLPTSWQPSTRHFTGEVSHVLRSFRTTAAFEAPRSCLNPAGRAGPARQAVPDGWILQHAGRYHVVSLTRKGPRS